ncbi:hypothetical protein [Methylobacterium sp. Gmos1]
MTFETTPPGPFLPFAAFVKSAVSATEQAPVAATPVAAPLRHTVLVGELATRSTANAVGTAQLLSESPDSDTIGELYEMHGAFVKQLCKIDQDWRAGLLRVYEGSLQLRKANTLSKVIEQEYNLIGQYGDLATNYMTSVTTLIDNTTVGYSYWLSKKIQAARSAKATAAA